MWKSTALFKPPIICGNQVFAKNKKRLEPSRFQERD